jgi:hypothetical protein
MKNTNASNPALLRTKKQILKRMHKEKLKQIRLKSWMKNTRSLDLATVQLRQKKVG